jgi:hypothetical protein
MSSTRIVGLAIALTACATNPAPRGWLQPARAEAAAAFGAWVVVDQALAGELIAVAPESLYVMPEQGGVTAVPRDSIRTLRVAAYASASSQLASWTAAGTLGTASIGWWAAIGAPVWIVVGSLATGSQSHAPIHDYRAGGAARLADRDWDALRPLARFPQGWPEGMAPGDLRPRATLR